MSQQTFASSQYQPNNQPEHQNHNFTFIPSNTPGLEWAPLPEFPYLELLDYECSDLWPSGTYNRRSAVAHTSQGPSTNGGHSPQIKTQLPPWHQQICGRRSTSIQLRQDNICKHDGTYSLRVEGSTNRTVELPKQSNNSTQQEEAKQLNLHSQNQMANNVYERPSTKQIIHYDHASAGFPTKATWLRVIKAGFYATWPMLTTAAISISLSQKKHKKGHMRQNRQGVQSTKEMIIEDEQHLIYTPQWRAREINFNFKDMRQIMCTNQTGQFLAISSQGNWYIMVLCETDGNLILMKPMKNRTSEEMCKN